MLAEEWRKRGCIAVVQKQEIFHTDGDLQSLAPHFVAGLRFKAKHQSDHWLATRLLSAILRTHRLHAADISPQIPKQLLGEGRLQIRFPDEFSWNKDCLQQTIQAVQ
jgi:hypothetical protein